MKNKKVLIEYVKNYSNDKKYAIVDLFKNSYPETSIKFKNENEDIKSILDVREIKQVGLYYNFKEEQQKKINDLPIYWAFGQDQLNDLLTKLNLKKEEVNEKCFGIFGGLALKEDKEKLLNTLKSNDEELKDKFNDIDFMIDALIYEMGNHEYCITYEIESTLASLGLSKKDFEEDKEKAKAFEIAQSVYLENMRKLGW